jgi:hypothetical protein
LGCARWRYLGGSMDDSQETVDCVINNALIDHLFFNYIAYDERNTIIKRLALKQSVVVGFKVGNEIKFCAVLDFEPYDKILHVRQVGGFFGRIHDALDIFTQGFAKYLNYDFITFETEKRAVKKWAEKAGFEYLHENNQYQKVIH